MVSPPGIYSLLIPDHLLMSSLLYVSGIHSWMPQVYSHRLPVLQRYKNLCHPSSCFQHSYPDLSATSVHSLTATRLRPLQNHKYCLRPQGLLWVWVEALAKAATLVNPMELALGLEQVIPKVMGLVKRRVSESASEPFLSVSVMEILLVLASALW